MRRNDVGPRGCGYGGAKSDWPLRDVDPQSVISAGSQRCGRCKSQLEDTKAMRVGSKDWWML